MGIAATAEQVDAIGYVGGALLAGCFLPQVSVDIPEHPLISELCWLSDHCSYICYRHSVLPAVAVAGGICQIVRVIATRSVQDISILWSVLYTSGLALTTIYLVFKVCRGPPARAQLTRLASHTTITICCVSLHCHTLSCHHVAGCPSRLDTLPL
jgi:hypothetical protein